MPPRPTGPGPMAARSLAVDETMVWPHLVGVTLDGLQCRASGSLAALAPKRFTTHQTIDKCGNDILLVTRTK